MAPSLPPVFIVGAPRSGTTLLATMLASHSAMSCGPETHFFPYLEANHHRLASVIRDRSWPHQATRFVVDLSLKDYKIHHLFGMDDSAIYSYLATREPSLQALLESLTVQHMTALQKSRWAEKTPNHILHLAMMRRLYPWARIVRIVRDPRDVARSMAAKLPWASGSALDNAYLIDRWYRKSKRFFEQDSLTHTLQYEDLVTYPQGSLQALCQFIQIPFEMAMLDTTQAFHQTAPSHETWKQQVGSELDASRCFAWLNDAPSQELEAVSTVCSDQLQTFDYPASKSSLKPIFAHHTSSRFVAWLREHRPGPQATQTVDQLLRRNLLLVPRDPASLAPGEEVLFCDIPISGTNYSKSLNKLFHFCVDVVSLRLKGVAIKYSIFCHASLSEQNIFGKIAALILRIFGSESELKDLLESSCRI